jgi:hypothetical protein
MTSCTNAPRSGGPSVPSMCLTPDSSHCPAFRARLTHAHTFILEMRSLVTNHFKTITTPDKGPGHSLGTLLSPSPVPPVPITVPITTPKYRPIARTKISHDHSLRVSSVVVHTGWLLIKAALGLFLMGSWRLGVEDREFKPHLTQLF